MIKLKLDTCAKVTVGILINEKAKLDTFSLFNEKEKLANSIYQ